MRVVIEKVDGVRRKMTGIDVMQRKKTAPLIVAFQSLSGTHWGLLDDNYISIYPV